MFPLIRDLPCVRLTVTAYMRYLYIEEKEYFLLKSSSVFNVDMSRHFIYIRYENVQSHLETSRKLPESGGWPRLDQLTRAWEFLVRKGPWYL